MKKVKNSQAAANADAVEAFRRGLAAFEQAAIEDSKKNLTPESSDNLDDNLLESDDLPVINLKRTEVSPPPNPEKNKFNVDGMVDVVVFCEHPYFLNLRLTPWQKLILKVFYAGSPGNTHLKIEDTKTEDCSGCIWDYNRKFEKRYYNSLLKGEESGKNNLMPPENSPCLSCVRLDPKIRDARYNKLTEEVIRQEQEDEIEALKSRELIDMFQTEMCLLEDPEIEYKVRKQILDKFGRKFQELLLVLGRRSGKMLDLSTPLLTTNGWKTMGDVQVGDCVFSPDGSATKITAKSDINFDEQAYELEFSNGEIIKAGASHEWKTLTYNQINNLNLTEYTDDKIITTEDIYNSLTHMSDDGVESFNHAIPITQPLTYPNVVELSMNPYLLGLSFANKYRLNTLNNNTNSSNNDLISISREYFESSIDERMELLKGLNDISGYVNERDKSVEFLTQNNELAQDYHELVSSLGFKSKIEHNNDVYKVVCFLHENSKVFGFEPKQDCVDHLKFDAQDKKLHYITRCDKIKNEGMQCIEVDHPSHMYLAGRSLIPTHNSFLTAVITLYEVYRFLMMGHPQDRYPILEFDTITILNVAVSEGQAKMAIFDKIRQLAESSPYFVQSIGKSTQLEMFFLTDHDKLENKRRIERGQEPMVGTIQLKSGHSSASGMVGGTMAVIIIDEMAEMAPASSEGGTDDELYDKLKPAISTFGRDGKMICISNPLGPYGKFYKLYQDSFDDNMVLMAQLPTWLSNPYIEKSYLDQQKKKNPQTYHVYYGAKFGSSDSNTWIAEEHVDRAFQHVSNTYRAEHGAPLVRYYAHLDPAKSSDYYTLVVCHAEPMESAIGPDGKALQRIIIDHMHVWKPKNKNQPINSDEVDMYILKLATRFKFVQISYDQWNSQESIKRLMSHGLNAVNKVFDVKYKSSIYGDLYELFGDGRIVFYNQDTIYENNGIVEELGEVTECKIQFKNLQRKFSGKSFKIEARTGFHDDFPDAVAAAAYEALKDKTQNSLPRSRTVRLGRIR
jgi:hypothetical protein